MSFEPSDYGPIFGALLSIDRRRALDEGTPREVVLQELETISVERAFPGRSVDSTMANCCLSGVWLLHDYLDRSHSISQSISTREGSFWHGVMHRREGDYGNAKYWFRSVGDHPVYATLADRFGDWDPYGFVDACEDAVKTGSRIKDCLDRQQAEWETLFDWCWQGAVR